MKKIIAKKLVLIVGSTMVVILLLNFLIQREDALEYLKNSSVLVIEQIGFILDRNEQNTVNKEEVNDLIAPIPVPEGTNYYIINKEDLSVVGAIGEQYVVGNSIRELIGEWKIDKVYGVGDKYYYFTEDGGYYVGVSKPKDVVLEDAKDNMEQLFLYLFIASYVMVNILTKNL